MKKAFKPLPVVAGAVLGCLGVMIAAPRLARSADHLDAPATKLDHTADINDVFAFMDGDKAVFAMTVFPAADTSSKFSDAVAYVLHTESAATFGATTNPVDIICTFDTAQKISCWAGDEYVTGDASAAAGIASTSGKLKVFAGLRKDPFFFNLDGFKDTVQTVKTANDAGALVFDSQGCPDTAGAVSTLLEDKLQHTDGGAPVDFFKDLKTLAIVVEVDKAIVTKGGALVTVWGSTNKKQ